MFLYQVLAMFLFFWSNILEWNCVNSVDDVIHEKQPNSFPKVIVPFNVLIPIYESSGCFPTLLLETLLFYFNHLSGWVGWNHMVI